RSSAPKRCSEEGRKSTWRSQLDPGCSDAPVQRSETTANASGCAPTRAVVSVGVTWAPPFVMRTATSSDESRGEVVVNSTSPRSAMSCDGAGAARCAPHATQSAKNPSIDRDMNPPSAMCGSDEGAASEGIQAAIANPMKSSGCRAAIHRSSQINPQTEPLARIGKAALEGLEAPPAAQVPDVPCNAPGDHHCGRLL